MSVPSDLKTEPEKKAYKRGWKDRASRAAKIAGSTVTAAKSEASRLNGAKGGRPRKAGGK